MTRLLFAFVITFISITAVGQEALSHEDLEEKDLSINALNSTYSSAIYVFEDGNEKLNNAFYSYLENMNKFLHNKGFRWGNPTEVSVRIYFNAKGKVDYFIYNIINNENIESKSLKSLMKTYISENTGGLKADTDFYYSGTVFFED